MSIKSFCLAAVALLATTITADSTSIAPLQSTLISSALASYESAIVTDPAISSLAVDLAFQIPASELFSIASNIDQLVPFPTTDQYSFATDPPVTGFSPLPWATALDSNLQSDIKSLRISLVLAEASVLRSVLSISETPSVATESAAAATSLTGSSGAAFLGRPLMLLSTLIITVAVAFVGSL